MCDRRAASTVEPACGHIPPPRSVLSVKGRDWFGPQTRRSTLAMTTPQAAAPRPIPSIVHFFNPMVRRFLALGVPMGPNVLLTVRGRKSGKAYTFPVATLEVDGRQYLFSPFGEVQWVQNLRASGEAIIRRGRTNHRMTAVELTPEDAAPKLEAGMKPVLGMPMFGSMIAGWYGVDHSSTSADYLASARQHPAFALTEVAGS
jgi:deazaflavin-dependent oxidoreductase (nitroreductase family)